ncbi:MAG: immunity 51 family protein [Lachnospiraceae bacterium]
MCEIINEYKGKNLDKEKSEELREKVRRYICKVLESYTDHEKHLDNSGVDLFQFDSDKDVFCVFSQYIDDLMMLAKIIRTTCDNEKLMCDYLGFK